ncbi:tRNA lysidine(34) synthetase TilS [Mesorhizobium helmanticense]|uniref:tRNA(Ile)-lysidine synthase n=1 Tax=Mesorhizobium helmanticense TaxID=1776423 RepID=A0A2T4IM07_9HYPH|nr:tRNA lysidine(34) synthetase TilS [Mesorhizobium helmanticense]PTE06687.1 tRNA lysidine(34) synthetase TilS [Mesorhizobium helmanticense]
MLETEPDLSERLFSEIDFTNGAVAAVSGGSDSTALLLLLKDHLDRTAPATKLLAVTIDHGLRPDAASEARSVAGVCAERGIAHRILAWSGPKPSTGLPAAAREARYRLLAEAAEGEGIGLILTGHTADDQAETVLMRQARDEEEGRGLAGMAPATLYDWQIWIVRPLLGTRRGVLREILRRANVGWAEDPTNEDDAFERPRIRAALSAADGGQRMGNALALAGRAATEREELGRRAAALIRSHASQPADGLIRLDPHLMASGDNQAAVYALRILLATVGGVGFLPDQARSEVLFDRLRGELFGATPFRATLSRTAVDARRAGIFLRRETRNLPPAAPAEENALWDGRQRITLSDKLDASVIASLSIAPLGTAAAAKHANARDGKPPSLVRAALAAEPALWCGGKCLGLSGNSQVSAAVACQPVVAPFARFLPSFDLAPAGAVAELVGAPPAPALPFGRRSAGS